MELIVSIESKSGPHFNSTVTVAAFLTLLLFYGNGSNASKMVLDNLRLLKKVNFQSEAGFGVLGRRGRKTLCGSLNVNLVQC